MTAPPDWSRVRRVLAVRLDNLGDVVLLTPALRALRLALPHAELTLLCSPAGGSVAPLLPWIDAAMVRRVAWQDASGTMPQDVDRERRLTDDLRAGGYDAAFVFTSFAQSPHPPAYACYLAGVGVRIGQSKEFGGSVLSHPVAPLPDSAHQVDRSLHLLDAVGLPLAGAHLELRVPARPGDAARRLLARARVDPDRPYSVLAPGASCPSRRYPADRFAEAAAGVAGAGGMPVVVVGSEREVPLAATIARAAPGVVSLAGRTTVPELAAVIAGATVVIANNSGPMHLADAFRRPLVALFAGTELESQFAPRTAPVRLLRRPTWCSPCHAFACPYEQECLDLPASAVTGAALDLLGAAAGALR